MRRDDHRVSIRREIAELPAPLRLAAIGGVLLGALGCTIGLVIGLDVYAGTAWAAAVEVGLPSAVLGVLLGLAAGAVKVFLVRRQHSSSR